MTETLKIEIDINQVMKLAHGLSPTAMQNAWRRTLRKTGNWIKSQAARAVSKEMQIPKKVLVRRIYFFLRSRDTGKVWLGLNALEADRLGAPKQTRTGVKVGRHSFKSAWIYDSRWVGKEKQIPIRHGNGSVEMKRYVTSDINAGRVMRRIGKERTPYERVKVDWADKGEVAFRAAAAKAEERLLVILRQEVNYEIQKAIGRAR